MADTGHSRPPPAARAAWTLALVAAAAMAADRPGRPRPRATPPAGFDRAATATFFDDAFSRLEGTRPAFPAAAVPAAVQPVPAVDAGAGTTAWSRLVCEETLVEEVRSRRADVAAAVATPVGFTGGGYETAREAFTMLAVVFGVVAAYDGEVRWRDDAATARDLFGRAGLNCTVGTDHSLAESRQRLRDLESLLEGGPPGSRADRDEDFRWSQVARRPPLMARLKAAEESILAALSSRDEFERHLDRLLHDAEITAVIAEVIRQPDFEHHDDEVYDGHAAAMGDAARRLRDACRGHDLETARSAAGDAGRACTACHGDYRG